MGATLLLKRPKCGDWGLWCHWVLKGKKEWEALLAVAWLPPGMSETQLDAAPHKAVCHKATSPHHGPPSHKYNMGRMRRGQRTPYPKHPSDDRHAASTRKMLHQWWCWGRRKKSLGEQMRREKHQKIALPTTPLPCPFSCDRALAIDYIWQPTTAHQSQYIILSGRQGLRW